MPINNFPLRPHSWYPSEVPQLAVRVINPENGLSCCTAAIIDTGASASLIPEFISKAIGHTINAVRPCHCSTAGPVDATVYPHTYTLEIYSFEEGASNDAPIITIKNRIIDTANCHFMILGVTDFLKDYILTVNYPEKYFSLNKPANKLKN